MSNIIAFIRDSYEEIRKVAWPTRNQAIKSSIIVIIFLIISSIIFGTIDLGFQKAYEYILFNLV